jgi:divalent metal cation (Fe/Co/Zn/Cd) transporter
LTGVATHRHGRHVHSHAHLGPHRHLRLGLRTSTQVADDEHTHGHAYLDTRGADHRHGHDRTPGYDHTHGCTRHEHGHSHGLVDRSIVRSRDGVRAVAVSLGILGLTAFVQLAIFVLSNSVALLADLVHNFGDALTAVPLGIAFWLRNFRLEKLAGLAVVAVIFFSACVALYETILRFLHPEDLTHLWALAGVGFIGFVGNELAAQVRLRAGRRLSSPALVADGKHAQADGFVSLGVVVGAALVAIGLPRADPVVGLIITLVIFKITWDSWRLVSTTDPGEIVDHAH